MFTDELDIKLERATPDSLGSTSSIAVTKEDTIILNRRRRQKSRSRSAASKSEVASPFLRRLNSTGPKLQERLAKLSDGVAVIKVGGSSEVEVREK